MINAKLRMLLTAGLFILPVSLFASFSVGQKITDTIGVEYAWDKYTLNLRIEDNNFVLYFMDAERKVVTPPVLQASVNATGVRKVIKRDVVNATSKRVPEKEFILLSSNGNALTNSRFIRPPHIYYVIVSLLENVNGKAQPIETFPRTQLNQVGEVPMQGEVEEVTVEQYES